MLSNFRMLVSFYAVSEINIAGVRTIFGYTEGDIKTNNTLPYFDIAIRANPYKLAMSYTP